jgi:hypothetical protein
VVGAVRLGVGGSARAGMRGCCSHAYPSSTVVGWVGASVFDPRPARCARIPSGEDGVEVTGSVSDHVGCVISRQCVCRGGS